MGTNTTANMSTEIICTLISVGGVVLSAILSFVVSAFSASKEIKKKRMEWEREDIVSSEDEFAQMVAAVSLYANTKRIEDWNNAVEKIGYVRAKENGNLATLLDELYIAVQSDICEAAIYKLNMVLEEKRNRKKLAESQKESKSKKHWWKNAKKKEGRTK